MKKTSILITTLFAILFLFSCKKETSNNGTQNSLEGDWKLVSVSGITEVNDTYTEFGSIYKIMSRYSFTSTSASGTYKITATNFNGQNIAYTTNGKLIIKMFEDNVLVLDDSLSTPLSVPPTNTTATYKKVGTDSLYFTTGSMVNISTGTNTPVIPGGMKYKIEGTKLTFNLQQAQNNTVVENGISINRKLNAAVTVILQK